MLDELRKLNSEILNNLEKTSKEYEKQIYIQELLKRKNIFLEIKIDVAYAILRDLKIAEKDIKDMYLKLLKI